MCLFECDAQLDWIGSGLALSKYYKWSELIKICKQGGATFSGCPCDGSPSAVLYHEAPCCVIEF